jgi:DNA-binding transcriptional regulator YiaG
MDNSNDQSLIDELARSLFVRHGYRQSLAMVDTIKDFCAGASQARAKALAAFWSRVFDAIRVAGRIEPILVHDGSLHRPADGTAIRHNAVPEPAALSTIDRHIGQRLRARRQEIGFPIEVLARSLDLSLDELKRIETGRMRLGAAKLMAALQLLRVDAAYVFQGYPGTGDGKPSHDDDPTVH